MPVTIMTLDDQIAEHGGVVQAYQIANPERGIPQGSWNGGYKPGDKIPNVFLARDGWFLVKSSTGDRWHSPPDEHKRHGRMLDFWECKWHENELELNAFKAFLYDQVHRTVKDPTKEQLKRVRTLIATRDLCFAEIDKLKKAFARPDADGEEQERTRHYEREAKLAAVIKRLEDVVGPQATPKEIEAVRMSLDQAMLLRGMGLNVHVGMDENGTAYGEVRLSENAGKMIPRKSSTGKEQR